MKKHYTDENTGISYTLHGDVYLPDLVYSEHKYPPLGKYGMLRQTYLKENHKLLYSRMLMNDTLWPHLLEIDQQAHDMMDTIVERMKLDRTVTKITGGAVRGGVLYLACDDGRAEKPTYAVDLADGKTTVAFLRSMGNSFTEAEGLAIAEAEGETRFCYLDFILPARVTLRTYVLG